MRYSASEKLELIRTVEGSHLPTKKTLDMLSIPRTTFYRWYDRYLEGGLDALADQSPRPGSVWNRIPQDRRDNLIEFALEHEELTTRELAVKYTDEKRYFISESSVYRILKAADRNRPIATAAYAAWLSIACAIGAQFHGSNSSRRLILWSWMRSRMSAR